MDPIERWYVLIGFESAQMDKGRVVHIVLEYIPEWTKKVEVGDQRTRLRYGEIGKSKHTLISKEGGIRIEFSTALFFVIVIEYWDGSIVKRVVRYWRVCEIEKFLRQSARDYTFEKSCTVSGTTLDVLHTI